MVSGIEYFLREQRALGGGYYREFAPSADLRHVVACTWISVVAGSGSGARIPIIPDGCSDILLFDAEAPQVVGPDSTMRWVELGEGAVITGLRLRPGAVRAVFGCSASTLLDQAAQLGDVGEVTPRFIDALSYAREPGERCAVLEAWVREALRDAKPGHELVLDACRRLSTDGQLEIGALAKQLGWNARMVHRQFVDACGYGPKHLQRVMRIQTALRVARASRGLSDLASAAGFADQAHMTREFRDLTGFTPAAYLATYSPEVGAWLTADW